MRLRLRVALLAALVLATPIASPKGVSAQGIGVNTQSACNSGRNEAVTGDPCADGSAVFYNPAALAFQPSVVSAGISVIRNSHTFRFDANPAVEFKRGPENPLVPQVWVNWRGGQRWAAGAGFWVPFGFTLKWPVAATNPFPGRFTGYDNTVKGMYLQPTVAYQLVPKRLSVGAGLDVVFATVDIHQRVDLATQALPGVAGATFNNLGIPFGTDFADARLKGKATTVGGHFAALLRINDQLSVGARYLTQAKAKFNNGQATFTQVTTGRTLPAGNPLGLPGGTPLDAVLAPEFTGTGPLANQKVTTEITFPAMFLAGIAYKPTPAIELSGDWQWTDWSKWDVFALKFATHTSTDSLFVLNQNTNTFRLGGQWAATRALEVRAGWSYSQAAETDVAVSPLLPEAKRNYYSGGFSYSLTKDLVADAFVQHVVQADRRGRVYPLTSRNVTASQVNVGLYTADANIFGLNLRYTFGPAR
jgi:long-chain fatty acid transport protein